MKVFLDCGTNLGQGLKEFHSKLNLINNPEWKIYCFEPNPSINLQKLFPQAANITYLQKAVWIENTLLEFRMQGKSTENLNGLGSKLEVVDKKYNPGNCMFKIEQVQSIDLSEFILQLVKEDSNVEITIKMDIEGAEFEVLQHLIDSNTLKQVKEIYCECHGRFRFPLEDQKKPEIKKEIQNIENKLKQSVEQENVKFNFWI